MPVLAVVVGRAEEEVDRRRAVLLVVLLEVLDHPGDLAVENDREDDGAVVLAARLVEYVLVGEPAPPARDLWIGSELDDLRHVRFGQGSQNERSPRNSMTIL